LYALFIFWDFPIDELYLFEFPIHPIINIILKSVLITVVYLFLIIKLNISVEITRLYKGFTNSSR